MALFGWKWFFLDGYDHAWVGMAVFGQRWHVWAEMVLFGGDYCFLVEMAVFWQRSCLGGGVHVLAGMVMFGQGWLCLDSDGCAWAWMFMLGQ